MKQSSDILIIGAGIAGLTCALDLKRHGFSIVVLEKSSGLGGRIATRRFEEGKWDHGIPWIDQAAYEEIGRGYTSGLMPLGSTQPTHWVSSQGLTQLPKNLAQELEVFRKYRVELIEWDNSTKTWTLQCDNGSTFIASQLVLTAPVPQAMELLQQSNLLDKSGLASILRTVAYRPQIIALIVLENSALKVEGAEPLQPIESLVDQGKKGIKNSSGFFSIYFNETWSTQWFPHSDEEIAAEVKSILLEKFRTTPRHLEIKRWKYSQCTHPLKEAFLESLSFPLYLTGDGFASGGLQGAIRSATALVKHLRKN